MMKSPIFFKKTLAFFVIFCIVILCNGVAFSAKKGVLVLPNGAKVMVDLDVPVYITKRVGGKLYQWVYNPAPRQTKPASYHGRAGKFNSIVEEASMAFGVSPKLIHSVIRHESAYNPRAVSPKGAQGLMQLMPATAEMLGVEDAFDPRDNIMGGTKYLRMLLDMFEGNPVHAVAAYNAGEGRVRKYKGIPPFPETKQYVARVMNDFWHK
jgi:soluble lytic murein transglycosylase-like protein